MAIIGSRETLGIVLGALFLAATAVWYAYGPDDVPVVPQPPTIGMITNNPNGLRNVEGFREGLRELGFGEADGVTFLFSGQPTPTDELEDVIKGMIANGADLIFTAGTPTGIAAREATRDSAVAVVFGVIADPVKAGVLTNLTLPGGNLTGVMLSQNQARRMQLLQTILPDAKTLLLPYNPDDPAPVSAAAQLDGTAEDLGLTLVHAHARDKSEVAALLAALPEDIEAVFMLPDSTVNRHVKDLMRVAVERRVPVSGPSTAQVEAGATMSYGIVHHEVGMQAARIAVRILRGANPADTPVETADYYLTVNVAAANRIGLELPESVLQQADVILREDQFSE